MLTEKIKVWLKNKDWYTEEDFNDKKKFIKVLEDLNIRKDLPIFDFFTHSTDPSYKGRLFELNNICWASVYSDYESNINMTWNILKLPKEYIPLDDFEAEGGFFYNRETGEILELEIGEKLINFLEGKLKPQWKDFNVFLEWYFKIE
ncbi:hypothetical protein [Lysinibacillus sp. NPDC093692]|uniref:hypothetical protein n=1 Tax=Lysinibacillus sp. NPDC093692 TaxID=3390578 RepID=UPI003CFFC38C